METWEGSLVFNTVLCDDPDRAGLEGLDAVVMVKDVPESQEAPQQQQLTEQWDQHQKQGTVKSTHQQGVVLLNKLSRCRLSLQSVDSSLGGLSRSSTVASLDTDSTKSLGQSASSWKSTNIYRYPPLSIFVNQLVVWHTLWPPLGNSTSDTCAEFRVKYVGAIEKLQFNMSKTLQEPLDLINYIDAAQVRIW